MTLLGSGDAEELLMGLLGKGVAPLPYERQRIELPDSDFIDIDWMSPTAAGCPPSNVQNDSVVVVLHGLEGSSWSPLARKFAATLSSAGFPVACANFRGCSGEPNRLLKQYHLGFTDDLDFLLNKLRHKTGGSTGDKDKIPIPGVKAQRIYLVGFSLGGNVALKYLGEQGARALALGICGAAVACVPFAPAASVRRMRKGLVESKIYTPAFLNRMKVKARAMAIEFGAVAGAEAGKGGAAASAATVSGPVEDGEAAKSGGGGDVFGGLGGIGGSLGGISGLGGLAGWFRRSGDGACDSSIKINLEKLDAATSFEEFDEVYTAKIFGFRSKDDYYSSVCAKQYLRRIRVPTYVCQALDDPFMDHQFAPTKEDVGDAPVILKYHEQGGHCGFILPAGGAAALASAGEAEGAAAVAAATASGANDRFLPIEMTRFVRWCHANRAAVDAAAAAVLPLSLLPLPVSAAFERVAAAAAEADLLAPLRTAAAQFGRAGAGAGRALAGAMDRGILGGCSGSGGGSGGNSGNDDTTSAAGKAPAGGDRSGRKTAVMAAAAAGAAS